MRTLADIKRRMVVGSRLEVVKHTRWPEQVGTVRTCTFVGPSLVRFSWADKDGWRSDWPKAKHLRIIDADTYEFDYVNSRGDVTGVVGLRFLPELAQEGAAS